MEAPPSRRSQPPPTPLRGPKWLDGAERTLGRSGWPVGFSLDVQYKPKDLNCDAASLNLIADETYRLRLTRTGTLLSSVIEEFAIRAPKPIDLLFVVDDSPAMADKQQLVLENLRETFRDISGAAHLDYRLAVTTTSVAQKNESYASGRFLPLDGSRPRVITRETPDAEATFLANITVGSNGSSNPMLARPAWQALREPLSSGHNTGFRRPGADLLIVVVAASADHDENLGNLVPMFRRLEGAEEDSLRFRAILPTRLNAPEGCSYEQRAFIANRFERDLLYTFGWSDVLEICEPGWGRRVASKCMAFGCRPERRKLASRPITRPEVFINGVPQPEHDAQCEPVWSFSAPNVPNPEEYRPDNSVDLRPEALPRAAKVTIKYETACF